MPARVVSELAQPPLGGRGVARSVVSQPRRQQRVVQHVTPQRHRVVTVHWQIDSFIHDARPVMLKLLLVL